MNTLRPGGSFVAKIFRGRDVSLLYSQLRCYFEEVTIAKPKSSRNSSIESFVVCRRFRTSAVFSNCMEDTTVAQTMEASMLDHFYGPGNEILGSNGLIVPFVACGDLGGWDADKSYPLELGDGSSAYEYREPVQPPIHPNYHRYQERVKAALFQQES
jgi:tRNA (cytidine32/guanosine34-2'-O)-methyltransferase